MRTPPDLPFELKAAFAMLAQGVSRKALAGRAAAQSTRYRAGGGSQAILTADDALAYAFTRMPATYAAAVAVFDALRDALPEFAPRMLLDVGAGPGTASFAAVRVFPGIGDVRLVDANATLRALALAFIGGAVHDALRAVATLRADERFYRLGDAMTVLPGMEPADLVVASYCAGEMSEAAVEDFARALWAATAGALAIVEPGTPAGCARVLRMRAALIAAGAHVAAPCPHALGCPLAPPDWCHFAQRLPRSRDHLRVKGADVPFEDEKFSYAVLSRLSPRPAAARVLAPPHVTKIAAAAKLCTATGIVTDIAASRDAAAYRRRKSWRWGDAVEP